MSYKYEDFGRTITVREGQVGRTGQRLVGVTVKDQSVDAMIFVKPEEAPAIALAILEAAGHPLRTYQPGEIRDLADVAHDALKRHLVLREEHAAREAEDLKVADFFTKFDGLTPAFINDHDRRRYRAARKFFEES